MHSYFAMKLLTTWLEDFESSALLNTKASLTVPQCL